MGKYGNIRTASAQDVQALIAKGFKFVVVQGRGADRGRIVSRHKTDAAAQKAAKPYSWLGVEDLSGYPQ